MLMKFKKSCTGEYEEIIFCLFYLLSFVLNLINVLEYDLFSVIMNNVFFVIIFTCNFFQFE